jgi:hypothetical protein
MYTFIYTYLDTASKAPTAHSQQTKKIMDLGVVMILPQVHLRKPCYDFTFL